jgi:type I restriction enzyme, S subunit
MTSEAPFETFYAIPSRNGVSPPKASRGSGMPMVGMGDVFGHPWIRGHEMERVPLTATERERAMLEPGDLLFARRSVQLSGAGVCSIYLGSKEPTTFESSLIRVRLDRSIADPLFFFYFFRSPLGRQRVETIIEQTAVAGIKASSLARLSVSVPQVKEQKRIARLLASLDNKIDNNLWLAKVLEEITATLFKARFMDFVKRDDLVESEIGLIPRGWSVSPLSNLGGIHRELTKGASHLPYIGLDDMPRGSTVLAAWKTAGAPEGQSANFVAGDILFGKLRPYFHKVGVAPINGRCSTEILVLRPDDPSYYGFLLGHVNSRHFIDHCVAVSRGTRMPRAEWRDAGTYKVAVPPQDEVADFTALTKTVYELIRVLVHKSHTLAAVRDLLLPRLISGQVRVPSEEQLAAKVA